MSGDVYAKVGAAIRAKRGDIGMTQSALADRTGLGRTSITNIESGTQSILLHQLLGIARALRVDVREFLVGVEATEAAPTTLANDGLVHALLGRLDRPAQTRRR